MGGGQNSIDIVFTDPPYDLGIGIDIISILAPHIAENAEVFIMHNERRLAYLISEHDDMFRRLFCVDFKVARLINNNAPMSQCDFIGHFRKGSPTRFKNLKDHFTTLLSIPKTSKADNNNFNHKHCKRVELPGSFITHFTDENDNVLDLFGGSGSTLIACEQLNRACYIMELIPKYCQTIINRWEEYTGQKAIKLN